jgi:hypothetical protein
MENKILKSLAVGACLFAAPAANAAVVVTVGPAPGQSSAVVTPATGPGSFTLNFNGFSSNGPIAGLTSTLLINFLGVTGSSYNFSYTLTNTSSAPIDASRVTIFGFNSNPNFTNVSAPSGIFNVIAAGQQPNGLANLELCFKDSGPDNNCTGANQGVAKGSAASGTFNLTYASALPSITLSDFSVRYQGIDSSRLEIEGGSANGLPQMMGAVPEPATWAMMILGFGVIGGAMRRRPSVKLAYA